MEDKTWRIVKCTIAILLIGIPAALWYFGQGVAAIFWAIGLVAVVTFAVATWWTRQTMAMGGELMLRAQESKDHRDGIVIREVGNMARMLMKQAQDQPLLPLDQADKGHWLPAPTELEDVLDAEPDELGHW